MEGDEDCRALDFDCVAGEIGEMGFEFSVGEESGTGDVVE